MSDKNPELIADYVRVPLVLLEHAVRLIEPTDAASAITRANLASYVDAAREGDRA